MKLLTNLISIIVLSILSFSSFSQLDSVSVNSSFSYVTVQDVDTTFQQKIITSEISISDFDFLGDIVVTFYDLETNYPIDKQKYSRQELIDLGKWNQGIATIRTSFVEENRSYKVEVIASNFQGLYLNTIYSTLLVQ